MLLLGLRQTFHHKQNISPQALNKKLKAESAAQPSILSLLSVTSSTRPGDSALCVLFDIDKDVFFVFNWLSWNVGIKCIYQKLFYRTMIYGPLAFILLQLMDLVSIEMRWQSMKHMFDSLLILGFRQHFYKSILFVLTT